MAHDELNPYASSDAPVAAEEVPPSRLRFYFICFACGVLVLMVTVCMDVFRLPDFWIWPSLGVDWVIGVLWSVWPELRKPGGIRNVGIGRLVINIIGVAIFGMTFAFLLLVAWQIAGFPIQT